MPRHPLESTCFGRFGPVTHTEASPTSASKSKNATSSPSVDTRGLTGGRPSVSYSTVPTGYSSRYRPATVRTTASDSPSGPQSAPLTFSRISRGAPPLNETRASVATGPPPSRTAISPVGEMASTLPLGSPNGRASRFPGWAENSVDGAPPHSALYTTVPPGANLAEVTSPRRNVSLWNDGGCEPKNRRAK